MNELPLISASLGFAGALACVWLAGAITRRAQRNAEVVVLLVMIGVVFSDPDTVVRAGFWALIVIGYFILIVGLFGYGGFFVYSLRNYESWGSGRPPAPSEVFFSKFLNALSVGFWPVIQLNIAALAYSHTSSKKKGRIASWILEPMSTRGPGFTSFSFSAKKIAVHNALRADEWKALLILFVGSIAAAALNTARVGGESLASPTQAVLNLADSLLPLLLLLPVIYYKMRFVFFDVIIKRGTALLALVVSCAAYVGWALLPAQRIVSERVPAAAQITVIAGIAAFVGLWLWFYRHFDRALDRYIFARPDYGKLSAEIGNEMSRFVDRESLLDEVTARLKDALKASYVRVLPPLARESSHASSPLRQVRKEISALANRLRVSVRRNLSGRRNSSLISPD